MVRFSCRLLSDLEYYIVWLKQYAVNDSFTSEDVQASINNEGSDDLVFENVTLEHVGRYTCLAGNIFGFSQKSAWLSVYESEIEFCTSDTCLNGGYCINTNDSTGHRCNCPESFTGSRCQSFIAMQPPCTQPIKNDDGDVNIFSSSDGRILMIILIIVCIILFLIVVVLVAFLIYRRRRKRVVEKTRATSTVSATTTILSTTDIGSVSFSAPSTANIYTNSPDDVFLADGESTEKPWKSVGKGLKGGFDNEAFHGNENHYERLEGGVETDVEHGYVRQDSDEVPDLPGTFSCDIKDVHGDTICMATKLADC